jgi:ribosomal protein S18 acetylase RimI-like enzyme
MAAENIASITVRDASEADVPALAAVRSSEALHRGRLRDAQRADFRYFVILRDQVVIGFLSLVFRRPPSWSNSRDEQHLPEIIDFHIVEAQRGQGFGSQAIAFLERIAAEAGYPQLYIAVDPVDNPRALSLYQRLGYQQLQSEPHFHSWEALDGDGNIDRGGSWLVNMVKPLQEN